MSEFNLADLWEAVADSVPDRVALRCGEQRRTYEQLEEQSNRLAHWYLEQGVQAGDHIGLYAENCVEYVEATLAAYKVRAVPININYRYTAGELQHLFNDADLVGVVHQWGFTNRVAEVAPQVPTLRWKLATGSTYDDALASSSPARDFGLRSGDDRYILYTGGTTGLPKGVVWRQEDAFFACMGGGNPALPEVTSVPELVQRIAPDQSTFLLLAPLMHAAGGWVVLLHLFSGNKVVLWSGSLDPPEVWRTIEREKVTATSTVGDAVMRPLLDAWDDFDPKPDIESLAVVSSGGAPLSTALRDRFLSTFPSIPLSDGYGSSETGIQAGRIFLGPIGERPEPQFTAQQAVVMDEETHRPVVPGSGMVGRVARTGRVPWATTRTRRNRPRHSSSGRDVDGRSPETWVRLRKMAPSPCSAGATCASTREARRSIPRRSRPCCASPVPSTTWWLSAPPMSAGGSVSSLSSSRRPGRTPRRAT